jgi:hypothetical protein
MGERRETERMILKPSMKSPHKAVCQSCDQEFIAELTTLKRHAGTKKHILNVSLLKKSTPIDKVFSLKPPDDTPFERQVKNAEILISGFFVENNISFCIVDSLIPLLKTVFPDSKVVDALKLGKTKLTNIIKNVIGWSERQEIAANLKVTPFSILVDKSTDISTSKVMAILVRYYCKTSKKIESHLWCLC